MYYATPNTRDGGGTVGRQRVSKASHELQGWPLSIELAIVDFVVAAMLLRTTPSSSQ